MKIISEYLFGIWSVFLEIEKSQDDLSAGRLVGICLKVFLKIALARNVEAESIHQRTD